jgi:hypothetical protein
LLKEGKTRSHRDFELLNWEVKHLTLSMKWIK